MFPFFVAHIHPYVSVCFYCFLCFQLLVCFRCLVCFQCLVCFYRRVCLFILRAWLWLSCRLIVARIHPFFYNFFCLFIFVCLFTFVSLFIFDCRFVFFVLFACLSYISGCWCGNQVGAFLPSNCGADPSIAALCGRSPRFCSGRAKRTLLARLSSLGGTFCHLIVAGGRGGVLESVRNPFPCFNVFVVCVWCVCTFYFAFLQFQML